MVYIHDPGNEGPLDRLYVFVSVDDRGEGICATVLPGLGSSPMVTGSRKVASEFKRIAGGIAAATGKRIELRVFERAAGEPLWSSGGG